MSQPNDTLTHADHLIRTAITPSFRDVMDRAIDAASTGQTLVSLTLPIQDFDPLAALEILGDSTAFRYYWEHPEQQFAIAAGEALIRIGTQQADRYRAVAAKMDHWRQRTHSHSTIAHSLTGPHFLGGYAFHDRPQTHHWRSFGNAGFVVPEWLIVRDGQLTLLTLAGLVQASDSTDALEDAFRTRLADLLRRLETMPDSELPDDHPTTAYDPDTRDWSHGHDLFRRNVAQATDRIRNGQFEKIVLAREVRIHLNRPLRVTHMLNHLRSHYPTCYVFLFQLNRGSAFLGASPERLASFQRSVILTEGLAGTHPRGKTATEDAHLEKSLLQSEKDILEHRFVVSAIAERLGRYTEAVRFPTQPGIRKYRNVQHLYTPISAELTDETPPMAIVEALHPTPAVGGHPLPEALNHLQVLEHFDRGWFAGPLGWTNLQGRGEFCVAIRSGLIEEGRVRLFAGCGIVAGSDPDAEWAETELKLVPMRTALAHG